VSDLIVATGSHLEKRNCDFHREKALSFQGKKETEMRGFFIERERVVREPEMRLTHGREEGTTAREKAEKQKATHSWKERYGRR